MVLRSYNPWETEDVAGLPVVIFFSGGGVPCAAYCRLQKLLSQHWRVCFYDRTGYFPSERGPNETLTAQDAARELTILLQQINIAPPYVLIGHSYGAIVARAFLDVLATNAVTGFVLAEAGTELMSQVFRNIPDPTLEAVAKGVDFAKLTNLKEESGMSDDEWKNAMVAIEKTRAGATAEDNRGSQLVLARRQQFARSVLSPWPVIVIRCNVARDYTLLYNAGVAMVNGTQAERASALDFIDRFQLFDDDLRAAQLRLPKCNRYVHHEYMGHDYVIRHPEAVVPDVKWVMEHQKAEL